MRNIIATLLMVAFAMTATAQKDEALLREIATDNQRTIEALVLYPPDARLAILEASKYPAVLIKMHDMQGKTSAAFKDLLVNQSRETQQILYEIGRYPGLITQLLDARSDYSMQQKALEILPMAQRPAALEVVQREPLLLARMEELFQTSNAAFESLIGNLPMVDRAAFRQLLDMPEVVELLNEDIRFTVMVGDLYSDNPVWVQHKIDSLQRAVAQSNAEELENWKATLENDPEAQKEFIAAGKEYTSNYYGTDSEDYPYDPAPEVNYVYVYHSYPYWFGYPWWEPYPRWRPYPYWYDWGYYYNNNSFVVVYLPSWDFMHWYFYQPRHHYYYSHLSSRFVEHYYGYRHSGTSISAGVGEWRERNRELISDDFLQPANGRLPEKLKEYGKFEDAREQYNARNPGRELDQSTFLDKNARKYPDLQKSRETAKIEVAREKQVQPKPADRWTPDRQPREKATEPVVRPPREVKPVEKVPDAPRTIPARPAREKDPVENARDYHQQKWDRAKPAPQPQPKVKISTPPPARAPKTAPKSTPRAPTKTDKARGG